MQISIPLVSLGIYSIFLYRYADFYHLTWLIENAIDIFVLVFQKSVPVSPPWLFQEESDVAMAAWVYVGVLSQNGERGGCPSIQTGLCDCCQEGIHQWWRGNINMIYLFKVQSQTLDINFKNDLTELFVAQHLERLHAKQRLKVWTLVETRVLPLLHLICVYQALLSCRVSDISTSIIYIQSGVAHCMEWNKRFTVCKRIFNH